MPAPYDQGRDWATDEAGQRDMRNRMVLETFSANCGGRADQGEEEPDLVHEGDSGYYRSEPSGQSSRLLVALSKAYDVLTAAQISIYPISVIGPGRVDEGPLSMDWRRRPAASPITEPTICPRRC